MKSNKLESPAFGVQLIFALMLTVISGLTIMLMWNWYVVSLGVPKIGLIHAIGIDALITFIVTTNKPNDSALFWDRWIWAMTHALTTLFIGWVIHFVL